MLFLNEEELSKEEREKLDDDEFGLPKERKFPLNDAEHVRKAIQFFYHAKDSKKEELAKNILDKAEEYDVKISDDSEVGKYIKENDLD